MIRKMVTDSMALDLSRIQSYAPAGVTLLQTLPAAVSLAVMPNDAHAALVAAVASYAGISFYSLSREQVVLFDTSAIALDALWSMFVMAVLDTPSRDALLGGLCLLWCAAGAVYKVLNPPHDRLYAPWAGCATCTLVVGVVLLCNVRAGGFAFDPITGPLRVVAYVMLAVFDGYATNVYASRRAGVVQRMQMSLFLHGSVLFAPTGHMLLILGSVLVVAQAVALLALASRDTSKKNEGEPSSASAPPPPRPLISSIGGLPIFMPPPHPVARPGRRSPPVSEPADADAHVSVRVDGNPALEAEFQKALAQTQAISPPPAAGV